MSLERYTTEELRKELKRRMAAEAEAREEKRRNARTCRNCTHCEEDLWFVDTYHCKARTYKRRGRDYNYVVRPCHKCEQFERKGGE